MRTALIATAWLVAAAMRAFAQPEGPEPSQLEEDEPNEPEPEQPPGVDDELGPVLVIERVRVEGNTATQPHVIERAIAIQPGDALRASDRRLERARFKVLALGFFRDVKLRLEKGSVRGRVELVISVVERGTIVLNRLWFGSNDLSPYWLGLDVSERNLLGLGVTVGGGFIYAGTGEVAGGRDQWAGEARAALPSLRGSRFGAHASVTLVHGSEPYQVSGGSNPALADLRAFPYRRIGGRGGLTYDVSPLTRLSASVRGEWISAELPAAPARILPDGRAVGIDLHLQPNDSRVATLGFVFDRDNRPDPILSHSGTRFAFGAELGAIFTDYRFATLFGRFEHYWPLRNERHTIALKIAGGVVVGDAPRFDRIYIADVNRMLTPRAHGLVLSTAAPLALLATRGDKPQYGDLGGHATAEYALQLFRGKGRARVYGGDLFFGVGLWGLAEEEDLRARAGTLYDALPLDIYVDAGVRIDTDIGIFEFTIANALGRVR
jgi:outer membrane protein assembly factor BamA